MMHASTTVSCGLLLSLLFVPYCLSKDREYTVKIPAGSRSCFYHPIEELKDFELEYQVIEGGDLDINVVIQSPSGAVIFSVQKKSDGIHKIKPSERGDHMLCFDNAFSSITNKLVFFAIIDDTMSQRRFFKQVLYQQPDDDWSKYGDEEIELDVKVEDIRAAVSNVHRNLDRTIQLQNMLRVSEARDRSTQERNCERVTNWSMIQVVIMLSVAGLQLFLIRSLFEEKSKINQLFKKASGHS